MLLGFLLVLAISFSLIGWGALFQNSTEPGSQKPWSLLGLLGFFPVALIALWGHFFIALSVSLSWMLIGIGIFLLVLFRKNLQIPTSLKDLAPPLIFLFLLTGYALDNSWLGDSWLYHLTIVKWYKQEPIVLGLAHIHDRLGVNSLWFLLSASMNPLQDSLTYFDPLTVVLMVFFFCWLWDKSAQPRRPLALIFFVATFFIWGKSSLFHGLGSPGTDMPAAIFTLVAFILWSQNLDRNFLFPLMVGLAAMVKISQGILFLTLPLFVYLEGFTFLKSRKFRLSVGLLIFLFLPWFLRNYFLTGCWLYPVQKTCFPHASWSLPEAVVQNIHDWIRSWARQYPEPPSVVLKDWNWLFFWSKKTFSQSYFSLTFFTAGALWLGLILSPKIRASESFRRQGPIGAVAFVSLIFWFLSAPDPRFGSGFWISFLALGLAVFYDSFPKTQKPLKWLFFLTCVVFLQDLSRTSLNVIRKMPVDLQRMTLEDLPPLEIQQSEEGVSYYIPKFAEIKDETHNCGLAPLPCANQPRPHLKEAHIWGHRLYSTAP